MAIPLEDAVYQALTTKHFYCRFRHQFFNSFLPDFQKACVQEDPRNKELLDNLRDMFPEWEIFEASPEWNKQAFAAAFTRVIEVKLKEDLDADRLDENDSKRLYNDFRANEIKWVEADKLSEPRPVDQEKLEKLKEDAASKLQAEVRKELMEVAKNAGTNRDNLTRMVEGNFDAGFSIRPDKTAKAELIQCGEKDLKLYKDGIEVALENYLDLKAFTTTTAILAGIIFEWAASAPLSTMEQDKSPDPKPDFIIPISFYLERTKKKYTPDLMEQIDQDLKTLCAAKLTFTEKSAGRPFTAFKYVNIFEAGGAKYGKINVRFTSMFFELLKRYNAMPIDKRLFSVDVKKHANSFELGKRLYKHKFINYARRNANCIPIKSILDVCSYADPDKNGRHAKRTIEAFTNDLDYLCEKGILKEWTYCKKSGVVLSDEELATVEDDYETWQTKYIEFSFSEYPKLEKRKPQKSKKKNGAK